jgi:MFS family permease
LGDRRVLLTGLGATAIWLALMALFVAPTAAHAPGKTVLAVSLLVVGLLGGSVNGSSGRAVMAWFCEAERGFAMSIRQTALPAGGVLGALILPSIASGLGFAVVYGLLALLCAVSTIFAWRWLHEPPKIEAATSIRKTGRHALADASIRPGVGGGPLHDFQLWRIAIAIGFLCLPQVAVLTFAAVFLHDFSHVGVATISASIAAVHVGAGIMRVWSGRWTDLKGNRRNYLRACSVMTAIIFAALAALGVVNSYLPEWHSATSTTMIATLILGGICASAWHGVAFTELATLAGASRAGTALALGNTFAFGAYFLAPLAIPFVLTLSSWPMVWLVASACACLALPIFPRKIAGGIAS